MLTLYPAIFYRDKDDSFSVVFPDLNHLATDGENLEEAMEMAIDCLAGYVYSAKQDGESLPEPTPVEKVDIHCEDDEDDTYESAFINLVAVDVEDYAAKHFEKPVKKTLTVPEALNKAAVELGINFSVALKNRLIFICSSKDSANTYRKENSARFSPKLISAIPQAVLGAAAVGGVVASGFGGLLANIFSSDTPVDNVNPSLEKNVKKTLTLPKWLNEKASAMNLNFSAVLRDALLESCQNKLKGDSR